jgi:hypothetical protein
MMNMQLFRMRAVRLGITGTVLAASTILGFNCSPFVSKQIPSLDQSSLGEGNGPSGTDPQSSVALLSSEQILKTMIAVTGTENSGDPTADDELINNTYAQRTGSLPSGQSLKLATAPMLIAVTNLASAVCQKAVDRDAAVGTAQAGERLFFREMDFSKGLSSQPADSVSLAFERLARSAWRRDITNEEDAAAVQFAQEFSTGVSTTDSMQTKYLAVSLCTAALSSIDALTY